MNVELFKEHARLYQEARAELIAARNPTQEQRYRVQAYGLAVYGSVKDNLDYIISRL